MYNVASWSKFLFLQSNDHTRQYCDLDFISIKRAAVLSVFHFLSLLTSSSDGVMATSAAHPLINRRARIHPCNNYISITVHLCCVCVQATTLAIDTTQAFCSHTRAVKMPIKTCQCPSSPLPKQKASFAEKETALIKSDPSTAE